MLHYVQHDKYIFEMGSSHNMKKKLRYQSHSIRVPYALSVHDHRETKAVSRVIDEHRTALGKETREFEKKIAALFGKKYGIMVNSGSSANLLSIELLNLPAGSEVITPVVTFNTTVAPLIQKGLVPVFVDVKPDTYLIDIDKIESRITKKTKALFIPSLIGNVPDMARLRAIADTHNLFFVEDSCDTLGATFGGKPTGAFSDISTTSFYGSHIINAGSGGGMICVNDTKWHERLLVLRGWGRTSGLFADSEDVAKRFTSELDGIPYDGKFIFTEVGYNMLPLEMSAAFGLVQLKKLTQFTQRRQKNFQALSQMFQQWDRYFSTPIQTPKSFTNWLAFPLTIKNGVPFSRINLVTFLEKNNIQTRPVFTGNILRQPAYAHMRKHNDPTLYPVTDFVMNHSFVIGCHQGISAPHLNHIKKTVEAFLAQYK